MKTIASLAFLAVGATAQVIESQSFGYGKTYGLGLVLFQCWYTSDDSLGSPPVETPFQGGILVARAMSLLW